MCAPLQFDKHSNILNWLNHVNRTTPFFEELSGKYEIGFRQLLMDKIVENKEHQIWNENENAS